MFKLISVIGLVMISETQSVRVNSEAKRVPKWIKREAQQFIDDWGSNGTNVTKGDFDAKISEEEKSSGEDITKDQKQAYDDEFNAADQNGDGLIDKDDMISYFKAMYGY